MVFNTIPGETQISMGTDAASAEEMGLATHKVPLHLIIFSDAVSTRIMQFFSSSEPSEVSLSTTSRCHCGLSRVIRLNVTERFRRHNQVCGDTCSGTHFRS